MRRLILTSLVLIATVSTVTVTAQADLDSLMARVLNRRDENWKKLQQYVLAERETLTMVGPGAAPLYGFRREYTWFLQDGIFVRSPLRADGVDLSDPERRRAEADRVRREQRRNDPEPRFLTYAYFLRFRFDPGRYALVGREQMDGREVLRVEYYPTTMFREGRSRPNRRLRERDADVGKKMNKSSVVTLWVDAAAGQILRYEMENVDMAFLPGASLLRVEGANAWMRMGQPFPGVWLPAAVGMRFRLASAAGPVAATYDVEYYEYREADVRVRVR